MSLQPSDESALTAAPPRLGAGLDFADPHSPLARYYLRSSQVALVALFSVVFVLGTIVPLWHTDVWGHLAFGRWMAEHGQMPEQEPFSPPGEGPSGSLLTYWLAQTGLYYLYHAGEWLAGGPARRQMEGGVEFLRLGHVLILLLRLGLLWGSFRRVGASVPLAFAALMLVIGASLGHLAVFRPQVLGELCFAAVLFAVSAPTLSRRAFVLVPLLLAVWANCHGSYLAGFALLGACCLGSAAQAGRRVSSDRWRAVVADPAAQRLLTVILTGILAVAFLNPRGPAIFAETLSMSRHPNVVLMDEWQPIGVGTGTGSVTVFAATVVLLAAALVVRRQVFTPTQLLVLAVFGVNAVLHQRMLVWWIMVVPWVVVAHVAPVIDRWTTRWAAWASTPTLRKTIVAIALAGAALLWSAPGQWLVTGRPAALEQSLSQATPWQLASLCRATPEVQQQALARIPSLGPEARVQGNIFASETLGDFLVWSRPPGAAVFMYTHVHLFSPDRWRAFATVKLGAPGWRKIVDDFRANLIVVEAETCTRLRAQVYQDPEWHVLVDETGVEAKRDKRNRLFIALRKRAL